MISKALRHAEPSAHPAQHQDRRSADEGVQDHDGEEGDPYPVLAVAASSTFM
jgi:hypothetical protein